MVKDVIEYDLCKNQINLRKHGISIPEPATIFNNPTTVLNIPDEVQSIYEDRFFAYGWTKHGDYVKIWYTYRGEDTIRIIGGRKVK